MLIITQLVDNTQVTNERLLVDNGKAMQQILRATQIEAEQSRALADQSRLLTTEMKKILQATQAETQMARRMTAQSQRLTEEMKKDSAAMKTVSKVCSHGSAKILTAADRPFDSFLPPWHFIRGRQLSPNIRFGDRFLTQHRPSLQCHSLRLTAGLTTPVKSGYGLF